MSDFDRPIVSTSCGLVEGSSQAGLLIFKGIPYAAPPVGRLRWEPPQPCPPWPGVRPARQYGPSAPQNPSQASHFAEFVVEGPQSEDCLYLNIWTPGLDDEKRPVMVWIHGGIFTLGSGSQSVFDGRYLAAHQNIVVITINYRLGWLGFLNWHKITEGQMSARGNEGLLDQIAALGWIRDNIAAFGGDPQNITLFGESAGGASIAGLMSMPAARGLFHKAIMQSNIHHFIPLSQAVSDSCQALDELGLTPENVSKVKSSRLADLLSAQQALHGAAKTRSFRPAPVIDGEILPLPPLEAWASGLSADIPVIIGTNREETALFLALHPERQVTENQVIREAQKLRPAEDPLTLVAKYRRDLSTYVTHPTPAQVLVEMQTDVNFRQPALSLAAARRRYRQPVFVYQFNWSSPALGGILGACHAMEIGFIFGNYDSSFGGSGRMADALSRNMQLAWAAFARRGNPSDSISGTWLPFTADDQVQYIDIRPLI
jgi:para-nitrobenzyl esterase